MNVEQQLLLLKTLQQSVMYLPMHFTTSKLKFRILFPTNLQPPGSNTVTESRTNAHICESTAPQKTANETDEYIETKWRCVSGYRVLRRVHNYSVDPIQVAMQVQVQRYTNPTTCWYFSCVRCVSHSDRKHLLLFCV